MSGEYSFLAAFTAEELRWDLQCGLSHATNEAIKEQLRLRGEAEFGLARRRGGPVAPGWEWERVITCSEVWEESNQRLDVIVERALLQFAADVLVETHGDTPFGRVALAAELRKAAEGR